MSETKNKLTRTFIAKTFAGLEETLAGELNAAGARSISIGNRSVYFKGDKRLLYNANLQLRTALRILMRLSIFNISSAQNLYEKAFNVKWENYFDTGNTFTIDTTVNSKYFNNSSYAALKVKDAIADRFRRYSGKRPSVDKKNPDFRLNVYIHDDNCTISLDSSGEALYKRGYRKYKTEAPLNEVLAAGLILITGWNKSSTFVDAMCGSGTIPIEAALIAYNIPPGSFRKWFGFMNWKDFENQLWSDVKSKAASQKENFKGVISASDISAENMSITVENIKHAGLEGKIKTSIIPIESFSPPTGGGVMVINPPYGERLKNNNLNELYKNIGNSLKHNFAGFDAWIISSNKEALKHIGLKTSRRMKLFNGPLETKFHKFSIYEGSKKLKK